MILTTGRTLQQGRGLEEGKLGQKYKEVCAIVYLSSDDIVEIQLIDAMNVKISSDFGNIVVPYREDNGLPKGVCFMPLGPCVNQLVNPDSRGSGMPDFKYIEVTIESVKDENVSNWRK